MKKRCVAIVLSAGQGKRMGTSIQKQYIELCGKPIICYCLEAFEKSEIIDDVIMVAGAGQEDYVTEEIVNKYHFGKVRAVVSGGKERYDSVWNGLKAVRDGMAGEEAKEGYVYIHDGARPVRRRRDYKEGLYMCGRKPCMCCRYAKQGYGKDRR